ncbi:MarR family transcriptional regulator [Devosia oryziradicis]|uniref:MarR family transcriptional regulator n=1 Tax=Devosia oryziradicis TaxID=2801335 RepID=A0ABX7C046_9HYPH|nr:MarR family transcriptional regulator [Devosia oryziradicis]QQR36162.1 MarR family transcriptional regulator [Devosia oryziradicis]
MSSPSKDDLISQLGGLVMRWQDANQRYDEAVGARWGLNASERLCLSFLMHGPQTASAIAAETRLTPAAVTALVDRLAERGFVRRRPDANDRRKVMVEAADAAHALAAQAYGPPQQAGAAMLARYSAAELDAFIRILEDSVALQRRLTEALIAEDAQSKGPPSGRPERKGRTGG